MKEEIPILKGCREHKSIFGPKEFLKYKEKLVKKKINVPKNFIITFYEENIKMLSKRFGLKPLIGFSGKYSPKQFIAKGKKFGIIYFGIGSAYAGTVLEELIAAGAKNIISIGSAGALSKKLKIGDLVLADRAIRDEGTSYHYTQPSKYAFPSKRLPLIAEKYLKQNKIKYFKGTTWTTDAPYRETFFKAKKYQKEGVLTVEMEASAMFSIAKFRKVDFASLFYVSDYLSELKFNPHFHTKEVKKAKENILNIAIGILKMI